jgi:potassium efflux system protein
VRAFARLLVLMLSLVLPAAAQEVQGPPQGLPYGEWERMARRAEVALEENRASNAALEQLRADLVGWRATFQTAAGERDGRIDTLRAQIEALGPAPAEGESEPEEIANRRSQLNSQLARLEAPGRSASEAYSRADNLIGEIDRTIRERQASELMTLGPSPLNPGNWPEAVQVLVRLATDIARETRTAWSNRALMNEARQNLPVVAVLIVIGLVLVMRGRRAARRFAERVGRVVPAPARNLADFLLSTAQVFLPWAGLLALTAGLVQSNLFGVRGAAMIDLLPGLGIAAFGARWLAGRIFPRAETGNRVLELSPERRAEGRFFATLLGLMLWLMVLVRRLGALEDWSAESLTVLQFPALVVAGLCLVRLGQLIGPPLPAETDAPQPFAFRRRLGRIVGRLAMALGVVAPVLAAVGYQSAANFLTVPTAVSLALLAGLVLLQTFATEAYALATRRSESEMGEALVPVLIGLALGIGSIPLFALIWGARVADLTEVWTRISEGFALGETRISPGVFLTFVVVFGIGYAATRLLQGTLRSAVLPKTRIDAGGQAALVSGIGYVGIILASIAAIVTTGIDLSGLAIVFGALSVGIGFGLQNIVQNFIAGIIMLVERPVALGDWIEVGGKQGIVRDISVRSTRIETFDRTDVIVPNAEFISGIVTNWTRGNLTGRIQVSVGVAYGSDTRQVERILTEIAEAHPLVTMTPPPRVELVRFGADSMDFQITAILRDVYFGGATKSELHHEIARRFTEEGIVIPFAQRDVWIHRAPPAPRAAAPAVAEPAPEGPHGPGDGG